jgi:hypothetical protein
MLYEGVTINSRTEAITKYTTPNKRVWKLPTSTQLLATWHTDSLDMVVLPSTGASCYHNCCIDVAAVRNILDVPSYRLSAVNKDMRIRIPHSDKHALFQRDQHYSGTLFSFQSMTRFHITFPKETSYLIKPYFAALLIGSSSLLPADRLYWRHRNKFHWSTPCTYPSNCYATPSNTPPYAPLLSCIHSVNTNFTTDTTW